MKLVGVAADEDEAEACGGKAEGEGAANVVGSARDDGPSGHDDQIIDDNDEEEKRGENEKEKENTKNNNNNNKEAAEAIVQPPLHLPQPEALPRMARSTSISHEEHRPIQRSTSAESPSNVNVAFIGPFLRDCGSSFFTAITCCISSLASDNNNDHFDKQKKRKRKRKRQRGKIVNSSY